MTSVKLHQPMADHVLSSWEAQFDEAHLSGGYFTLIMHPQLPGRPSRFRMVRTHRLYQKARQCLIRTKS
ncbi:hypothetical protein [Bradyrhizobium zhanjiangense]|uniref:Uncharacterized protein n=1 Tax=Bradyrhizobium zhanjiangense TaxID=1325107 RepID=A0A4Q0SS62_9BRAD|nr:hypothetical protein [Bradyrhizobium zhanjiangense]RXH42332.1 hypothetical protein XH94_02955 [Bradyrhizobium zhanjiangense]